MQVFLGLTASVWQDFTASLVSDGFYYRSQNIHDPNRSCKHQVRTLNVRTIGWSWSENCPLSRTVRRAGTLSDARLTLTSLLTHFATDCCI